jgi:hypothetical protein
VDVKAFMAFTEKERRYLTGEVYKPDRGKFITTGVPGKPYFIALMHCVTAANALHSQIRNEGKFRF